MIKKAAVDKDFQEWDSKEKARFQVYVLPVPLQDNLCDGTEAPPDITTLLNFNTYEEGGLAYQVHITAHGTIERSS